MNDKTLYKTGNILKAILESTQNFSSGYSFDPSKTLELAQAFNLIATAIGEENTIRALEKVFDL